MTDRNENSGNAFPAYLGNKENWDMGMSLRDWFAGQALAGIAGAKGDGFSLSEADSAAWAYHYADAMLEARGTKK